MSVYATPEERALEWAYLNTAFALKEHTESPVIDSTLEPNRKKRKRLQHERGIKTCKLRTEMQAAREIWRSWKLRNDPRNICACGKDFKSHKSHEEPTKLVCHACLLGESTFQDEFKNELLASVPS